MKMTLPFKPHVLALICSAGLCAASTGLYIKSRTVEAPVEPQSTQLLRLTSPQLRFLQRFPCLL